MTITDLSLIGGESGTGNSGGGIFISTGETVKLTGNHADLNGGAIFNDGSSLTIDSTAVTNTVKITGNSAIGGAIGGGGGIFSAGGTVVISKTTISTKTALTALGNGGAILIGGATGSLTVNGGSIHRESRGARGRRHRDRGGHGADHGREGDE